MPHHKSAVKRLKTNEKSRQRNSAVKSNLRKQLKRQRQDSAESGVSGIYSELDTAVRKGVIPKARADRLKSRTARRAAKTTDS
jgi:small subunit ribosomal protein S20